MDRQTKAVETAIEGWLPNDGLAYPTKQMAQAAIAASDARFVPMLVDYIRCFVNAGSCNFEHRPKDIGYHIYIGKEMHDRAKSILEQLPEELRK